MKQRRIVVVLFALLIPAIFVSGCGEEEKTPDYACNYLNKTLAEIEEIWGVDHTTGGVLIAGQNEGLCYEDKRTPYIFFFGEDKSLPKGKEDTVTMIRVAGGAGEISTNLIGEEPGSVLARRYPMMKETESIQLDTSILTVDDEENDIRVSFIRMNANLADKKKPADAIEVQRIPH